MARAHAQTPNRPMRIMKREILVVAESGVISLFGGTSIRTVASGIRLPRFPFQTQRRYPLCSPIETKDRRAPGFQSIRAKYRNSNGAPMCSMLRTWKHRPVTDPGRTRS